MLNRIQYCMVNIIQIFYCNSNYLLLRLTTMALYLSWERCLSSRLWLFRSPGTGESWHRSGPMWTIVGQGESSTGRARILPFWGRPRVMSGRTSQSSPTSMQRGSSSLRGTKLLSLEATLSHRYKLSFDFPALLLPTTAGLIIGPEKSVGCPGWLRFRNL